MLFGNVLTVSKWYSQNILKDAELRKSKSTEYWSCRASVFHHVNIVLGTAQQLSCDAFLSDDFSHYFNLEFFEPITFLFKIL